MVDIRLTSLENVPGLTIRVLGNGEIQIDATSVPSYSGENRQDPCKYVSTSANAAESSTNCDQASR
jgi:hypothetical protein